MSTDSPSDRAIGVASSPITGTRGVVSAGDSVAASVAASMLDQGGNAVDAALAGALVQTVVEPPWCSIGGDAFILIATPDGDVLALNGSGFPPSAVHDRIETGTRVPRFGPLSIAVPGFISAWFAVAERFATLSISDLFAPAIRLAREGFALDEALAAVITHIERESDDDVRAGLEPMLRCPARSATELFIQPDLAATLERLAANGAREFYEGETAKRIVTALQERGGVLSEDDLALHKVRFEVPLETSYRGRRVLATPPVSLGVVLLEELAIAAELDLRRFAPGSVGAIDAMLWCKQAAFADMAKLGDLPDVREIALSSLDPCAKKWATRHELGAGSVMPESLDLDGGLDTTSISTADAEGFTAVIIHSVFNEFGSREVMDGTGILMNDRLANLVKNLDAPNGLRPSRRPLHTLNAYLVLDEDGSAVLAGATPGGRGQVQTNFQVLSHVLDFDLDIQSAVEQPRWLSGTPRTAVLDDAVLVESQFPPEVVEGLVELGYDVEVVDTSGDRSSSDLFGGVTLVSRDPHTNVLAAAADPRRRVAVEAR